MAQMIPPRIELTAAEAFRLAAAFDSAFQVLRDSEWITVAMDVEEAYHMLIEKLFPEDQE